MYNKNLTKAIPIRLTQEQNKALEKLKHIGFNRSSIIRIAVDEYLKNNYKMLMIETKEKLPF